MPCTVRARRRSLFSHPRRAIFLLLAPQTPRPLAWLPSAARKLPRLTRHIATKPMQGLDPLSEVMLAWRHNGRLLQPDHGYPLRVVIPGGAWGHARMGWGWQLQLVGGVVRQLLGALPLGWRMAVHARRARVLFAALCLNARRPASRNAAGYIGGRCVKWLTKIELSAGGTGGTPYWARRHCNLLAVVPGRGCPDHFPLLASPAQRRAATTTTSRQGIPPAAAAAGTASALPSQQPGPALIDPT